ncbi:MAG: hypothetical protein RMM17_09715 [Acidobacteriota bacterium]|nr:hypothetical protein [Blastocatellia bacterium]MDW8412945.1 hypothetical protein [Acidobacteriota bacterium]
MFRLRQVFHKHSWSTPHFEDGRHIMRCYECGAVRVVRAELMPSAEIQRRQQEAKEALRRLNEAS